MDFKEATENQGIGGYCVIKKSWRGSYYRLISIGTKNIATYNLTTFEITNQWEYNEIAQFSYNYKSNPKEFILCVPKGKGKGPSNMIFQGQYIEDIVSQIYIQFRFFKCYNEKMKKTFKAFKICRNAEIIPITVFCTPACIEVWSDTTNICVARYFYIDIISIQYIRNTMEGVAIKTKFNNRMHAILLDSPKIFIDALYNLAKQYMDICIPLKDDISLNEFKESRLGDFVNLPTSLMTLSSFEVHKFSDRFSEPVARLIGVSENAIIEHEPSTYSIVSVHHLKRIYSFYRSPTNPQEFGIEWNCGSKKMSKYYCIERDALLATFLDAVRGCGNVFACVHSIKTDFSQHVGPMTACVCEVAETTCLRLLVNSAFNINDVDRLNTNIPVNGFCHIQDASMFGEKKEKLVHDAINNLCIFHDDFQKLKVTTVESIFFALKRLFSSKAGFEYFSTAPKVYEKIGALIMSALKINESAVTYSSIELLNTLIIPVHPNSDLYYEQQSKFSVLSNKKFIAYLLDILRRGQSAQVGALVVSSLLDFITFAICPPFSQTTHQEHFDTIVELVSDLDYSLFRFFNHSSPSIIKSIGLIVKSIIEEASQETRIRIQGLALSEGLFPKHLYDALFTQNLSDNSSKGNRIMIRQLSRHLLTHWVRGSEITKSLLYRAMPAGLINYLYSDEKAEISALDLSNERLQVELKTTERPVEDFIKEIAEKADSFYKHWHTQMTEHLGIAKKEEPIKAVVLREAQNITPPRENWDLFYEKFYMDIYLPDLIWNQKTREELKDALEAEIRALNIDKELGGERRIGWNFEDFEVSYPSLKDQLKIGEFYLNPLLEIEHFKLSEPLSFFSNMYHVFLQSKTTEMKYSCIKAMTKIYPQHYKEIGKFDDINYIFHLFKISSIKHERDLFLDFLKQLVLHKENARKLILIDGLTYLVDLSTLAHLHMTRAVVPLQTLMLEGSYSNSFSYPEWYINQTPSQAFSVDQLKEKYKSGEIKDNTKIWAQGMEGWKPLEDIVQLKWTIMDTGISTLNESDVAITALDTLIRSCNFFPNVNDQSAIIRPLPRSKRQLSNVQCLPHICQLLLTFYPPIVERVSILLNDIMLENPVLPQLYITGCYYFLLMYTGSNIAPIAKFLKSTHLKQGFSGEEKKRNTRLANSILSPILPEALISYLECYDHNKFAEAFLGECDSPELIWSSEMRRHMMEKIALHLADFTPRVMNNIKTVYIYCPIPHVEYEVLKKELYCGRYYLKNLCDTVKFPNWPIVDIVQTLRDILDVWKQEVNKKMPSISLSEALKVLELEPEETHEDSAIRRAYYKLATKYHPDKNPDGKQIFEQIVKAYEHLCNYSNKDYSPSTYNIRLILKSQSILFVNHKTELQPYKYPGYPMLIQTISSEIEDPDLFSKNLDEVLLLPAIELAHHTIACSALNAEELRRDSGISLLAVVFNRCVLLVNSGSKPDDLNILIIENVIRCFIASARFEGFINLIIEIPEILYNFNYILMSQENLTSLCCTTVECIVSLCSSHTVQVKIYSTCLIYHLILYLFLYDYTLCESGIQASSEFNIQQKRNELSRMSLMALAIMSVSGIESEENVQIKKILSKLLTAYVVEKLVSMSQSMLLKLLNTNVENPYMKWNNNTRSQLKSLLEEIKKSKRDNEESNHQLALDFQYEDHKNELVIGGVFVEIFNKMPTFKIEGPKELALDILELIYAHSQFLFNENSPVSYKDLYKHKLQQLTISFTALYNVIPQCSVNETFTKQHFSTLLSFFSHPQFKDINKIIINILNLLVRDSKCISLLADSNVLAYLNLNFKTMPEEYEICLSVIHSLCSCPKIVAECITRGTFMYLLDIFCNEKDILVRQRVIEIFARWISDRLSGPRVKIVLQKFLPNIFIDSIMDDSKSSILLYESEQENPELEWNEKIRSRVQNEIRTNSDHFYIEQLKNSNTIFEVADDFSLFAVDDTDLVISGVNLKRFIAQPFWVLRHPKNFLVGLLDCLSAIYRLPEVPECDKLESITSALCLFLEAHPLMRDHLPNIGHIPSILAALQHSEPGSPVIDSCLKIIFSLAQNKLCVSEANKDENFLVSVINSFDKKPESASISSEILSDIFKHRISLVTMSAIRSGVIQRMVPLLERPFAEITQPSAVRAHIAGALQYLEQDPMLGIQVSQILSGFPIWKTFKFQKHDLFIENQGNLQISSVPAGVAGYLMAAHNPVPQTPSSASTIKYLLNSVPPAPTDTDAKDDTT